MPEQKLSSVHNDCGHTYYNLSGNPSKAVSGLPYNHAESIIMADFVLAETSYDIDISAVVYVPTDKYKSGQTYVNYPVEVVNPEGDEVAFASVYEINGKLGAVGIFSGIDETDLSYTIEILDGEFGKELLSFSGKDDIYGYHLEELPEELEVGNVLLWYIERKTYLLKVKARKLIWKVPALEMFIM